LLSSVIYSVNSNACSKCATLIVACIMQASSEMFSDVYVSDVFCVHVLSVFDSHPFITRRHACFAVSFKSKLLGLDWDILQDFSSCFLAIALIASDFAFGKNSTFL